MSRWTLVALLLAATPAFAQAPPAQTSWRCGEKRYCTQMTSCAEAEFHYRVCGLLRLDRDRDGQPCEDLCRRERSTRRR
ncbi:excalibur calcium-binding domain-containing protein [Roseomonas sp. PWR1]|uniref:Excalibur calcium-binding domain-containing protein n=1 Tax=Roseomonas nitratireducens TaxID=2820810 RepID=A0ABS4AMY0_9PROT|nr:excalibur calcium-binding domain-containing protein [Neoroseomonas nitratireducens]MBP0462723.1 excalibur calcium-binding domain-containing protein [Neoroseomonas nitratireducens]